jgi:hypothetical protein
MKTKLMIILTMLGIVVIPFINASADRVEKINLDATTGAGAQVRGATYRVVLNGFRVNRETYDTAFETDGKGDEVFLISEAVTIDRAGGLSNRVSRQSKTYGDINGFPERVQAGFRSDMGGLKTDDRIPNRDHLQPRRAGTRIFNDDLPMLVWQGNLQDGQNAVVIMPTIWEWDQRSIHFPVPGQAGVSHNAIPSVFLQRNFDRWLGDNFGRFVSAGISTTFTSVFAGAAARTGWARERSNADIFTMGTNGTRVIGLQQSPLADTDVFQPMVLILTYSAAEQSLRSGNGIFELRFEEPRCCGLEGSYSLFLQLERVP